MADILATGPGWAAARAAGARDTLHEVKAGLEFRMQFRAAALDSVLGQPHLDQGE
jgi:hypothetical protein